MPGGASSSGSIGATEGHDIFAGAGICPPFGLMSPLDGADLGSIAGAFATSASIAITESHDSSGFAATDVAFGSISINAGNDSPAMAGVDTAFGSISISGAGDALTSAGVLTTSGSIGITEAHDIAALVGGLTASGSIGITESHDVGSFAGHWGSVGSCGITEATDTPSASAVFTVHGSTGIGGVAEGRDTPSFSGTLTSSGSIGVTERHDALVAFGYTGLSYNIYSNTGAGDPINYSTPVATTSALTYTSAPLAFPGTWMWAVRAFNAVGEEKNLDCEVTFILDAAGFDITNRPFAPFALRGFATKSGGVRLEWKQPQSSAAKAPIGFHVYYWSGGTPNYSTIRATVSGGAALGGTYVANLAGLTDGVAYSLAVRAFNTTAEENNTATVSVVADATGPSSVISLTSTVV